MAPPLTWRGPLAAQWHAQGGSDPGYRTSATTGYDRIASVAMGADERQAVVTFSARRFAEWQGLFSPLLPALAHRDPRRRSTRRGRTGMPVTGGPVSRWGRVDRVAQTVTLDRNSRWWGTPPKLDRVIFKAYDPAATPDAPGQRRARPLPDRPPTRTCCAAPSRPRARRSARHRRGCTPRSA